VRPPIVAEDFTDCGPPSDIWGKYYAEPLQNQPPRETDGLSSVSHESISGVLERRIGDDPVLRTRVVCDGPWSRRPVAYEVDLSLLLLSRLLCERFRPAKCSLMLVPISTVRRYYRALESQRRHDNKRFHCYYTYYYVNIDWAANPLKDRKGLKGHAQRRQLGPVGDQARIKGATTKRHSARG
jgi:hypothetical protein